MASNSDHIDSESEEDLCGGPSDEDENYEPSDGDQFERASEESDDDNSVHATQEEREQAILRPNTFYSSKDKRIQYSKDDCPVDTRRRAVPVIHKGMFSAYFCYCCFDQMNNTYVYV